MKKLILLLCACIALPADGAMMHRAPKVNVDAMLNQLKKYEQLSADQMITQSKEINDLIAQLHEAKGPKNRQVIEKAVKNYRAIQDKKIKDLRAE